MQLARRDSVRRIPESQVGIAPPPARATRLRDPVLDSVAILVGVPTTMVLAFSLTQRVCSDAGLIDIFGVSRIFVGRFRLAKKNL